MKTILALAALVVVCAANTLPSGVLEDMVPVEEQYQRYYEYADEEGNTHIIDVEEQPDPEVYEADFDTRNAANNAYFLYTRRNRILSQTLINGNDNSIRNSNFDASRPTVVIAHGWLSRRTTEPNPTLRAAVLDHVDANVIVVDWSDLASSGYATAAAGVPGVGRGVGQFMSFINRVTGAPFNNMHFAGFSLGAHLVGNAGRELGGRVARVTGLDPAGPLWTATSQRLRATDGVHVEAIHTDGGYGGLGIGSAIARADFFPNGGNSQPGCYTSLCNHNRAWELFASSIPNRHLVATGCTTSTQITWNTCRGNSLVLGNLDMNKTGSGMYRLDTGRRHPY